MDQVLQYYESHREDFQNRLMEMLRIPSISAQSAHVEDVRRCAGLVRDCLVEAGLETEIMDTGGHPAIVADTGPVDGDGPVLLVYGHYDVQPEGDLKLWDSPPFEPAIRDGAIFARGAADDKGQMITHIFAAECWMKTVGKSPVRLKFLIEGEEEVGSENLEKFIVAHREKLACDYVLISDTSQLGEGQPAVTYGTKGLVYKEIILHGPKHNLHSGSFGGTVANPGNVMAHILATLYDADGRVAIPGFYDDVVEIGADEKAKIAAMPFKEDAYLEQLGSPSLFGEPGYTTLERRWVRPTLDVNGLVGGYTGEGASTVIPAQMTCKVSMRLVPNQEPERISDAFDKAVRQACPRDVRLEIVQHGRAAAYVAPLDSPGMAAAARAFEKGFGIKPVFMREGGSLPILPMFKEVLGADSILMGFALPNCNLHGPNEFLHVRDFEAGIRTSAHAFGEFASL